MVQAHVQLMWPRAALAGLLLLLGACSVQPVAPPEPLPPVEVAEDSPAASLLALADSARARNDFSAAGRYLERALSVSRSGEATVLYRELAELRLAENEPRAAEGLALRALRKKRGYTQLHLNEEVAGLVTTAMYEVMAKSMLSAMGKSFVSPRSEEQKQAIVVNLVGAKDAKELAAAARRGEVFFRETRLGACTSRTLCAYGGIESVARCAGGDGGKPCVDVLFDRTKAPVIEKDLQRVNEALTRLPEGSPRHAALLKERQGLENFLNVVRKN